MTYRLGKGWGLGIALAVCGAGPSAPAAEPTAAESRRLEETRSLAARIDHHIGEVLAARGVRPAPRSGDGEFIRRAFLDLSGRIPDVTAARNFLDDRRPDKRLLWAEQLLADERYAHHFAHVWRATLLRRTSDDNGNVFGPGFENWLREKLRANAGYDKLVRELVTGPSGPTNINQGPFAFYLANEQKPENLAASVSRLFLGINLECAQCHPHPFARWKREQFWELTAFFARGSAAPGRPSVPIPNTDKVVEARFLDGKEPKWGAGTVPVEVLADWIIADDNPYFARAAVNRVWAYFFGIGLIEPLDEPGDQNPPSHPGLLDELAREFRAHRYDLQYLIRGIVASEAYQRTSAADDGRPTDPRLFARMSIRGLSPEQLLDSLAVATGFATQEGVPTYNAFGQENLVPRAAFLAKFTGQESRTETQTSILQALHMMNGPLMGRAVAHSVANDAVHHLATVDYAANKARAVDTLYVLVLSRRPSPEEIERVVKYVDRSGPGDARKQALGDVLWALLNSAEFMLNH
jgi:hypothetical protein